MRRHVVTSVNAVGMLLLLAALQLHCASSPPAMAGRTVPVSRAEVDVVPEPRGGLGAIHRRIRLPEQQRESGVVKSFKTRYHVEFVTSFLVDANGKVHDPKIVERTLVTELSDEQVEALEDAVLRGLERTTFTVGKVDGEPVPVQMTLPFTLRRQN